MNRAKGGQSRGYTIIETMIFLAVSASMFISAMAFINGRQGQTEFSAAVRDFEANLNDVASDVATGYYASGQADAGTAVCTPGAEAGVIGLVPRFTTSGSGNQRGSNNGCIFIGKSIHFAPNVSDGNGQYVVYSLAGLQYKDGTLLGGDSQTIDESKVRIIPDSVNTQILGGGASFGCVLYSATTTPSVPASTPCSTISGTNPTGLISFFTTYQSVDFSGSAGGSNQVNILVSNKVSLNAAPASAEAALKGSTATDTPGNPRTTSEPRGGVYICLQSNGSKQHAILQIGGNTSRFTSTATIRAGDCS